MVDKNISNVGAAMGIPNLQPEPEPGIPPGMAEVEESLRQKEMQSQPIPPPPSLEVMSELPPPAELKNLERIQDKQTATESPANQTVSPNNTTLQPDTSLPSETVSGSSPESAVKDDSARNLDGTPYKGVGDGGAGKTIRIGPRTDFEKFCEFIDLNWNSGVVAMHLQMLGSNPMVMPSILLWQVDIPAFQEAVLQTVRNEQFRKLVWPILLRLMGDSLPNSQWSASVMTTLAVFSVLAGFGEQRHEGDELPEVQEAKEDNK